MLAALLVLAVSLCAVDAAQAGSLLSGYGGPGQGNQAILGSTLLGGRSGGGGSGGSAGGGGETGSANGSGALTSQGSGSVAATGAGGVPGGHARATAHHNAARTPASARNRPAAAAPAAATLTPAAASVKEGSQPLGLSSHDLLYALLVLVLLAATAVLTLRLARPGPRSGSTKGMGRGTRVTE
jgi:hypothetical protein